MPKRSRKQRFQSPLAKRFQVALAKQGVSIREWFRRDDAPCSRYHLYECFAKRREMNAEIRAAIYRVIDDAAA